MPAQPPILTPDLATGRIYISTKYRNVGGAFTSLEQTDVTDQFQAILDWLTERGQLHTGPRPV